MREHTDEALMKAYANGSMEAFELLYRRHRGPLYRYVLRQAGDPATANDLYQGSWEKIIRVRKSYRVTTPFRGWMFRIARNHVIDHFRRLRPVSDLPVDVLATAEPGPEGLLQNESRLAQLHAAISNLPPEQKETLLLKLEAGLDIPTIAEVTGVSREAAKSRLRYAVARLKGILEAGQEGPIHDD